MHFLAELSCPVLVEAWVYLSTCYEMRSNTEVSPMLRAGSVG